MPTFSVTDFNQQIDKVLALMDTPPAEAKIIKDDLLKGAYVRLLNKFLPELEKLDSQQAQSLIQDIQAFEDLDQEDEKLWAHLEKVKSLMLSLNFDFESELENAFKEILSNFMTKIGAGISG